jgi:hypothetical protein
MKHNKTRNVGIILELLNNKVSKHITNDNVQEAGNIFSVIRQYFLEDTYIKEVYNKVYSPILYGETNNYFYADRFLKYILEEAAEIDENKLGREIDKLLHEISSIENKKQLFASKAQNYKLYASLKCLYDGQKLTAEEKLNCEHTVLEHLIDNKEVERINESADNFKTMKSKEQIEEEGMAMLFAFNKFKERYNGVLTKEQNDCLIKYLTTPSEKSFKRWVEKRALAVVNEIEKTKITIEDEQILEKLELASDKFLHIVEAESLTSEGMINLLLAFELKDCLNLF